MQSQPKKDQAVRIVGGKFKGRILTGPKTNAIRPTSDRARESLFNILAHAYPDDIGGARVLDLFAGTGAVGIEAVSREAAYCLFVENSIEGRSIIRANLQNMDLGGVTRIFRRDATNLGPSGNSGVFNFIFADPPYGEGLGQKALISAEIGRWIAPNALIVLEEKKGEEINLPPSFEKIDCRSVGISEIHIFRHNSVQ